MNFALAVADPRRLHRQLDRLASRANGRRRDRLVQDGVRFTQLLAERDEIVALLGAAMADATYRPGKALLSRSYVGGKLRDMAQLGPLDLIVHGVVAEVLSEQLEAHLSSRVYSYRIKRSPWDALRWLAKVAQVHRAKRPDPRTRGLYVLRSDIERYGPSIPLAQDSRLWPELVGVCGLDAQSPHWHMLRALIMQEVIAEDGTSLDREKGVLFGAPTTNALSNLYLMPLDAALLGLRGAYARFGDDVLFAHADSGVVRQARIALERVLAERGLQPNAKKLRFLYWNGAARPSPDLPDAIAVSSVQFLGGSVGFDGTIALAPAKWRAMLADLRGRIRRTVRLMPEETPETRARVLASVVNAAFDLHSDLALAHGPLVSDLVSDRNQLAELDYLLARWVAEASTGSRGPRAFRRLGYRWLRREGGLESRVVSRNRGPRAGA